MSYATIRVRDEGSIRYLQLYRPEARNTINAQLIAECTQAVTDAEGKAAVLVIEGLPDVFCFGADFQGMRDALVQGEVGDDDGAGADRLYRLWLRIATGPFITIAHVRGQANAGGIGFVSACDIVLADDAARFSLSELLFGLYPACVLPFLIRRIGLTKANYMTVSTQPVGVEQAASWGLVDAWQTQSDALLSRYLLRLRRLSPQSVAHYKNYLAQLTDSLSGARELAVRSNLAMNELPGVAEGIVRYVETGRFPWEA